MSYSKMIQRSATLGFICSELAKCEPQELDPTIFGDPSEIYNRQIEPIDIMMQVERQKKLKQAAAQKQREQLQKAG